MTETSIQQIDLPAKRVTGETVVERMTDNAVENILPARYLLKDVDGNLVEEPAELFERVAKNVALADVIYEGDNLDVEVEVTPDQIKHNHSDRESLVKKAFGTHASLDSDTTVPLTEENVKFFSYDTVVPELDNDELRNRVEQTKDEFQEMMEFLEFMANSPTLMNAGDELQQLSACFVNSPEDDMDNIHQTINEAAATFKSGGGMGYAFWRLRPYGDRVGSSGGIASGPMTFMQTFDRMCETVAQGGKRRGAQMGIMAVSHPDIIQFIHAKDKDVSLKETLRLNDPDDFTHSNYKDALDEARELIDEDGRVPKHLRNAVEGNLSNFNISVGITDDFIKAVKNGEDFTFTNPRTDDPHIANRHTKEMYERHDLGDHVEVGEPLTIPAKEIWQRIAEGAHENGEPGVVFLDRMNKEHSFDVEEHPDYQIFATNPCGEQPLMEYEACNLGHINLSTIVTEDQPNWHSWVDDDTILDGGLALQEEVKMFLEEAINWEDLNTRIDIGTHFLENVVTMSDFPIPKIEETVNQNRKIGLGIMGLAQMYTQIGVRYGSDVGNEIARQLMVAINQRSKQKSHELALNRGSFGNHEDSKYADPTSYPDWFTRMTGEDPKDWENGFPIRNHSTTTVAPTGTTSMLGNTSGGCEPIYNVANFKNVTDDVQGDEMLVQFDDYFLRILEANGVDTKAVKEEAEELMRANEFDGVDSLDTVPDAIKELIVTTDDVSAKEHAQVQCSCQEGVDSAISKTVNAPNDSTVDDAMELFEYIYENGGKGVTYYRDGTRSKQVLTTRAQNKQFAEMDEAEIIQQLKQAYGGISQFLNDESVQAELDDELEEVADIISTPEPETFAQKKDRPDVLHGVTQRIKTGYGKLYVNINEDPNADRPFELFANIGNSGGFTASFTEALAKMISTALRAGVDPEEIADELQGIRSPKVNWDKGEQIQSIPDAIGTALGRYLDGDITKDYPDQATIDEVSGDDSQLPAKVESEDDDDTEKKSMANGGQQLADDQQKLIEQGETPECPECGAMSLYFSEGCKSCEACGWSEC